MFDNCRLEMSPREVHHHEHRAPTDESVRLLCETEDRAMQRVVAILPVTGNSFHGTIIRMEEPHTFDHVWFCKFELNGETYETERIRITRTQALIAKDVVVVLRDAVADAMASKLLVQNPGEWVAQLKKS